MFTIDIASFLAWMVFGLTCIWGFKTFSSFDGGGILMQIFYAIGFLFSVYAAFFIRIQWS